MTQKKPPKDRFYFLTGIAVMVIAGALFAWMNTTRTGGEAERDGQLCILAELQDHRVNSYDADRDAAAAARRPFTAPRPAPHVNGDLRGACDRFISRR